MARLQPWLPPQYVVCCLGPVSRSSAAAVRQVFEVAAQPGEDIRPLLAERVPDFGTLRLPRAGAVLAGAIQEPFTRSVRIAAAVGGGRRRRLAVPPRAPLELMPGSLYELVEFRCARLCLEGLVLRGSSSSSPEPGPAGVAVAVAAAAAPPLRLVAEEATVTCRSCVFEVEVTLVPPRYSGYGAPRPSLIEGCTWSGSPGQGLVVCGMRPGGRAAATKTEDPEADAAFAASGLTALRHFAGDLGQGSKDARVVVPNGLRFCAVRDCEVHNVRHHALLLRWDVFVLIERCALHGKVLIEEGPTVELRHNPELVLGGERLAPDFVGIMRGGSLRKTSPPRRRRRQSGSGGASASRGQSRGSSAEATPPRRASSSKAISWHGGGSAP